MTAESHGEIRLKVTPNASRSEVVGFADGVLRVRVAAPPLDGKANRELILFLSGALGVSRSSLNIVRGQASRNKIISVAGLSPDEVIRRLGF